MHLPFVFITLQPFLIAKCRLEVDEFGADSTASPVCVQRTAAREDTFRLNPASLPAAPKPLPGEGRPAAWAGPGGVDGIRSRLLNSQLLTPNFTLQLSTVDSFSPCHIREFVARSSHRVNLREAEM